MLPQLIDMQLNQVGIWEKQETLQQIKTIYGKNLNPAEFNIFMQLGKATGLNPFLKEIWAVKYKDSPAQIFVGRDGYRKSAQSHPEYDYHLADAVYSNDDFKVENGEVKHSYNLKDRGKLIGAYCTVKRKHSEKPIFNYVELAEYNKFQSVWKEKPATMIKKVAEAQALRMAFQELFAGTYHEYENWNEDKRPRGVLGLKQRLGINDDANEIDMETGEVLPKLATDEQVEELNALVTKTNLSPDVVTKWLSRANVSSFKEMPKDCIQKCIDYLKKQTTH